MIKNIIKFKIEISSIQLMSSFKIKCKPVFSHEDKLKRLTIKNLVSNYLKMKSLKLFTKKLICQKKYFQNLENFGKAIF